VAQIVKSTPGALGYVDFADAKAAGLTYASVKNKDGSYVAPSIQSATTAADNATINPDLTFSAIWAPGAGSYPITYQSWDLVFQKQSSTNTAKMLKAYLGYLLGDGQKLLTGLNYAPLPTSLDEKAKAQLSKIGT
jgi:phosphate transport system substrate-binding protein